MAESIDEQTVDAHIDALVDEDVLHYDEATDELATTDDFESHRHVYYDTYLSIDEAEFHESVADAFDLPSADAAADHVEDLGVTREEFATYLTLQARLDGHDRGEISQMAGIVVEVGPQSPVPDALEHLDDDSWPDFVDEHDRAVVTIWKRDCAPCEGMKDELDDVVAAFPDDAAVGGLDGEQCPEFCRTHEVNAAPAVVFFDEGEHREEVTGRTSPGPLEERATSVYDD